MSAAWQGGPPPEPRALGLAEYVRLFRRGAPMVLVLTIGFVLLLILRLPERAIWDLKRPVTPSITLVVCKLACWFANLHREVTGSPMRTPGAYVANHVSWLDILVLNASKRLYFVAKAEVSGWSGIGWLARGTGTVFIRRNRMEAARHARIFEDRLLAGHHLLFFPEGTSSDGQQVLPFKTTLFAAFFSDRLRDSLSVQPITLRYIAPVGAHPNHYGWWGDMDLGPSLLQVLIWPGSGRVQVMYHPPLKVSEAGNRKTLAKAAEVSVRQGLERSR